MGESVGGIKPKKASKKGKPTKVNFSRTHSEAQRVGRTASWMWDEENDPFQVFEVEHESCYDLQIEVKNGEGITKGFCKDLVDIPDPYVILRIPGSANSSKRTSHVQDNVNPIWDETFHFYLDPKVKHLLYVTLMDANTFQDENLGMEVVEIENLIPNVPTNITLDFPMGSKVYTTLLLQKNQNPDLRFSLTLCEEEKNFLRQRRFKVMLQMQELLGKRGPQEKREVPIIAVLGSGGGFRAMMCMSAAVKALHQSGILGCSTYLSGLSGSSWFLSTLYSHDNFPKVTYDEIYEELKTSVTQNWKWNLMHSHRYALEMMAKSRGGQPISFTDVFGHLLGDVLLKGKKHKKLSEQRAIVSGGNVPLPLYTCLHAKASVSCRSYSEWIEFSPFEIGIAKYGTFMKTEYFGSKFLIGKLIKQFPEFPLHYLQGVWGSAFTILMKRLAFGGGTKQDIVQMMRDATEERAIHETLEDEYLSAENGESPVGCETDTDDELDIEGADDKSSDDNETTDDKSSDNSELTAKLGDKPRKMHARDFSFREEEEEEKKKEQVIKSDDKDDSLNSKETVKKPKKNIRKFFSFDEKVVPKFGQHKQHSQDDPTRKISTQSDPGGHLYPVKTNTENRRTRIARKGAIKESSKTRSSYWNEKRNIRKSVKEQRPSIIQNWMKSSGFLNSRAGRAGEILNPFRGLSLRHSFPISPFSTATDEEDDDDGDDTTDNKIGLKCRYEPLDNTAKRLFIVDSGLAFNSPYPLLLRPQRAVDMYLSFDFSQRPSDNDMPFKELLLAEKWAQQNQVVFPPIEKLAQEFSKDREVKELYIFKDPENPFCPVILHFTIVNNKFKWYKAPGVQRETTEEIDFADFSIFTDKRQPYASTNFVYEPLQYERLFKLVEFNTLINIETIKEEIAKLVEIKRKVVQEATQNAFARMQQVVKACNKFKSGGNMGLRINEDQRKQLVFAYKSKDLSRSVSSSWDESFYDTQETLEDFDESESEYDAVPEEAEEHTHCDMDTNETKVERNANVCARTLSENEDIQFKIDLDKDSQMPPEVVKQVETKQQLKFVQNITAVI